MQQIFGIVLAMRHHGTTSLDFFESTLHRFDGLIKTKGVIADSGFYIGQFIELLENRELKYIIAARLYYPLQWMIYAQQKWQQVAEGIWVTEFFFSVR